jgi:hypothetical protein
MKYSDKIVFLSRREFPDYEGLKLGYSSDPDRLVAFRAFTAELNKMPLEELDQRCVEQLQLEKCERKEAAKRNDAMAFFSRPEANANFAVWCALDKWTIDEATALLLGKDPSKVNWKAICDVGFDSIFADSCRELHDQLLRARKDGKFSDPDEWEKFVGWAHEIGIALPAGLNVTPAAPRIEHADDLKGKKKNSALRLILGMALAKYGYDPKASKNQATSKIVSDLELNGLGVTGETVKTFLDEAVAQVLEQNPK